MYKAVGYIGLFMSIFFIFAAGFIAIKQILPPPPPIFNHEWTYFMEHPSHFNYLMAALLGAYGIFRLWRSYKVIKYNKL